MHRITIVALAIALAAPTAHAQLQRRPAPPGEPLPEPTESLPRKRAFDGTWDGWFVLRGGPGADARQPLRVALDAGAAGGWAGANIEPDGSRTPHQETVQRDGALHWRLPNSGGGYWEYSARLVSRDSIAGTLRLRDWPQLAPGERAPSGTFVLVRRGGTPAGED